jgi:hypothetical protein
VAVTGRSRTYRDQQLKQKIDFMPEEPQQKAKFIALVDSLKTRPKVRAFGNNAEMQAMHDKGVEFVRAEILKPEIIALLGADYNAVKASTEALS